MIPCPMQELVLSALHLHNIKSDLWFVHIRIQLIYQSEKRSLKYNDCYFMNVMSVDSC